MAREYDLDFGGRHATSYGPDQARCDSPFAAALIGEYYDRNYWAIEAQRERKTVEANLRSAAKRHARGGR